MDQRRKLITAVRAQGAHRKLELEQYRLAAAKDADRILRYEEGLKKYERMYQKAPDAIVNPLSK